MLLWAHQCDHRVGIWNGICRLWDNRIIFFVTVKGNGKQVPNREWYLMDNETNKAQFGNRWDTTYTTGSLSRETGVE